MRARLQSDSHQTHLLCERLKKSLKAEKEHQDSLQSQLSALANEKKRALDACEISAEAKQHLESALSRLKVTLG